MKLLAVAVLLVACDGGKKQGRQPDKQPDPTPATPAVDPACAAKTQELKPWLDALAEEEASGGLDFGYVLQVIDRPPAKVPHVIDTAELRGTRVMIFDVTESNHVGGKPGDDAKPADIAARLVETFASKATKETFDHAPDTQFRIDVDKDVAWSNVVAVADGAIAAGYTQLIFAFTATSKLAPPDGVPSRTETTEANDAADAALAAMKVACKPLDSAWSLNEVPPALQQCNCAVPVDEYKKQLWITKRWHQAKPRVAVLVDPEGTTEVAFPAATPWSEAHAALIAAAPGAKLVVK